MSSIMRGNFRMALSGVRSSKWRSVLTMTGVIVGIVAVVTVVGIGEGVKHQVAGTLERFGKDLIIVRPGQADAGGIAANPNDVLFGQANTSTLTIKDVDTIAKTPGVKSAVPLGVVHGVPDVDGHHAPGAFVLAAGADTANVLNQPVAYGEFWHDGDQTEDKNVAVVGRRVATDLFDESVPLGRSFTFRGQTFVVRGVMSPFLNVPFSPTANFDDAIFIPYQTAARLTQDSAGMYVILVKPSDSKQLNPTIAAVNDHMRNAHGGQQDFTVMGPKQSLAASKDVVHLLTLWIVAVAIISLFIGGVGIMNIMLLTVTERMHEIGVRKAIGATSRQILGQFVLEATVLSALGGIIGVVLSLIVDGLLYTYTDLKPIISWQAIAIATGVSLAIGIVFGALPAAKAASKDPIQALRHE
jgi:ABC-type antimicrobial peptide transport system permease subunit